MIEVVTLTRTLTNTSEYRVAAVLGGDVADKLHHVNGFTNTRTAEQTNLTALSKGANQIDDFDTGFQQLVRGCLIGIARGLSVDRHALLLTDRASFIDRLAEHVHDATQRFLTDRYGNRGTCVGYVQATFQALGGAHGNGAYYAVAQLLLDFEDGLNVGDLQRVVDLGHRVPRKLYVNHRADDLYDTSAHLGSSQKPANETCLPGATLAMAGSLGVIRLKRRRRSRKFPG